MFYLMTFVTLIILYFAVTRRRGSKTIESTYRADTSEQPNLEFLKRQQESDSFWAAESARKGIPVILARLEDRIFRGLPSEKDKDWREAIAAAMRHADNPASIWPRFAAWLLEYVEQFSNEDATRQVIRGLAGRLNDGCTDISAWKTAAAAVEAVKRASHDAWYARGKEYQFAYAAPGTLDDEMAGKYWAFAANGWAATAAKEVAEAQIELCAGREMRAAEKAERAASSAAAAAGDHAKSQYRKWGKSLASTNYDRYCELYNDAETGFARQKAYVRQSQKMLQLAQPPSPKD